MSFLEIFSRNINQEKKPQPKKSEAPSHWIKCKSCNALMYYKEVRNQFYVCPKCGFHLRISAEDRIDFLVDTGTFVEHVQNLRPIDPLHFVDKKSYIKRVEDAKEKTGRTSSVISGTAKILNDADIRAQTILKVSEGRPNIEDMIKNGEISLVINTSDNKASKDDAKKIRESLLRFNIPYFTTIAAAKAAATAIKKLYHTSFLPTSLQEYLSETF